MNMQQYGQQIMLVLLICSGSLVSANNCDFAPHYSFAALQILKWQSYLNGCMVVFFHSVTDQYYMHFAAFFGYYIVSVVCNLYSHVTYVLCTVHEPHKLWLLMLLSCTAGPKTEPLSIKLVKWLYTIIPIISNAWFLY